MAYHRIAADNRMGLAWVMLGASVLGFSAVFVKWGLSSGASPSTVGLYRMVFALPAILLLLEREHRGFGNPRAAGWAAGAGVAFAGDLSLWHASMNHTSAANSTFLVSGLAPVWVAVFSMAVYRTRLSWLGVLGQLLGVCGALVLATARGARVGSGRGELLAIGASFCYAAFSLALGCARESISARQSLFWMSLGSLSTFLVVEGVKQEPLIGFAPLGWLGLVGLGLVIQVAAWLMINSGIARVPIALGALALSCQQLLTPFLAAWLLDEPLRPVGLWGGFLLLLGIYCAALGVRRDDSLVRNLAAPES